MNELLEIISILRELRNDLLPLLRKILDTTAMKTNNVAAQSRNVVLAGTSHVKLSPLNELRLSFTVVNDSAIDVYLYFQDSIASSPDPSLALVASGGSISFGRSTDIPYQGAVWASSASGTPTIRTTEISCVYP